MFVYGPPCRIQVLVKTLRIDPGLATLAAQASLDPTPDHAVCLVQGNIERTRLLAIGKMALTR